MFYRRLAGLPCLDAEPRQHSRESFFLALFALFQRTFDVEPGLSSGRGPVTLRQLAHCLKPLLSPDTLLISDFAAAYRAFASRHGITHETVNLRASIWARGAIHLNHVNGWYGRFKRWLVRFHGVASRYLVHYAPWRRALDTRSLPAPAQLPAAVVKAV